MLCEEQGRRLVADELVLELTSWDEFSAELGAARAPKNSKTELSFGEIKEPAIEKKRKGQIYN